LQPAQNNGKNEEQMMNCTEFRNLIPDLARQDASADSAVISALAHAESCRACDALLREAEKLTVSLRSLGAQHNFDAAPPRVEAALLAAFQQQHGCGLYLQPAKNSSPSMRARSAVKKIAGWLAVSAAGLAAAAVLAVLLTGYRPGTTPQAPRVPEAAPRETTRPASPRAIWADYTVDGETEEQAAAAYIPLNASFDPSWLEGGAIVRVVLSRPALESLGVPVIAGNDGEMLADMVVSNDGTPEAIRVVDWQASNIQ
jgi:hypothetical protein